MDRLRRAARIFRLRDRPANDEIIRPGGNGRGGRHRSFLRYYVASSPYGRLASEGISCTIVGMSETIRLSRTETFEHTIAGLLKKRAELFNEAERAKDRLAEIRNDIAALDRVLLTLGYDGNLDSIMPRQKRR
jgi:hypothetical protein